MLNAIYDAAQLAVPDLGLWMLRVEATVELSPDCHENVVSPLSPKAKQIASACLGSPLDLNARGTCLLGASATTSATTPCALGPGVQPLYGSMKQSRCPSGASHFILPAFLPMSTTTPFPHYACLWYSRWG